MPIYEYRCPDCGAAFDSIESYPPPNVTECPCGEQAEQQFPMPARTPNKWTGNGWGSAAVKASGPKEVPANALDTRPLADGKVTGAQWRKQRKADRARKRREWVAKVT